MGLPALCPSLTSTAYHRVAAIPGHFPVNVGDSLSLSTGVGYSFGVSWVAGSVNLPWPL